MVVASLCGALYLLEKKHPIAAGICLGIAMLKFTVAGPFLVALLFKRQYRAVIVTAVWMMIATAVTCYLCKTGPLEMLHQMAITTRQTAENHYGPLAYLVWNGMDPSRATLLLAGLAMGLGMLGFYKTRSCDPLVLFGIAGVVSRLATYHTFYDDIAMVFTMLALGIAVVRSQKTLPLVIFLIFGISHWAPPRFERIPFNAWQIFQMVAWAGAAVALALGYQRWTSAPAMAHGSPGQAQLVSEPLG